VGLCECTYARVVSNHVSNWNKWALYAQDDRISTCVPIRDADAIILQTEDVDVGTHLLIDQEIEQNHSHIIVY